VTVKRIAVISALASLLLPALAGAAGKAAAVSGIRIVDRGSYVLVEVDFPSGTVKARSVTAAPITKTEASVTLRGVQAPKPGVASHAGLNVAVVRNTNGLVTIKITFAGGRMKYLSHPSIYGNGLQLDLWKSAPPMERSRTCRGLTLSTVSVAKGVVSAGGDEHGMFENQFSVVVRGKNGAVLGRKNGVTGPGGWNAKVSYTAARRQAGTVEAVAFSPKDGSLKCIAQRRVRLPAS
jgi:hypothetical protein